MARNPIRAPRGRRFTVKINLQTDAFRYAPGNEIARILRLLADTMEPHLEVGLPPRILFDHNHHKCGEARITKGQWGLYDPRK
jgi:hypothetical protein